MILREARGKAGMSMQELGKAVGVTATTICRYEHGDRVPKTAIAKRLANILNIEWYLLIDDGMTESEKKRSAHVSTDADTMDGKGA